MFKKPISIVLLGIAAVMATFVYMQFTIFVIPPMAPLTEGKTLIIAHIDQTQFIDSPEAMCVRRHDQTNLVCRAMMLGLVTKDAKVYLRLPYIRLLDKISTVGNAFRK